MRLAYVIPTYPAVSTFIANEMIEVQEAGHDLVIIPLYEGPSPEPHQQFDRLRPKEVFPEAFFSPTVLWHALYMLVTSPVLVLKTLLSLHWSAGLNFYAHVGILAVAPKALATARRIKSAQIDRVHAHFASYTTTCAAIAGCVSAVPFSFTAHAYDIYCTSPSLRNNTLEWKLRHAIQVFAVSEYATNLLRQKLPVEKKDRVQTAYVGVPLDLFLVKEPPPLESGLRLLCIANYDEKKGLDTLIDACALLRRHGVPFTLKIYGSEVIREALCDHIARLGLEEHILLGGVLSQNEVAREMAACHVFVMACRRCRKTGNMDGIPTVFMEAMATGRPVVSCPISGIPELVRDGETGLLVPPDDPPALASALARLSKEEAFRLSLGRQARFLVENQHAQRANARRFLKFIANTQNISESNVSIS